MSFPKKSRVKRRKYHRGVWAHKPQLTEAQIDQFISAIAKHREAAVARGAPQSKFRLPIRESEWVQNSSSASL